MKWIQFCGLLMVSIASITAVGCSGEHTPEAPTEEFQQELEDRQEAIEGAYKPSSPGGN